MYLYIAFCVDWFEWVISNNSFKSIDIVLSDDVLQHKKKI